MIRYCSSSFSQQLRQGLRSSKQCSVFVGLGFFSRSFGGISEANELEQGPAEKTLKEALVTRPLVRSSRTNSQVRHLKERGFDDIIEREKKLKIVLSIKELLWAEPSRCMTLLELGTHKDDIGFNGNGRLVEFLKRYPGVFTVHETAEFGKLPWFQLTPEAEVVAHEESDIRKSMDKEGVNKLRKLLMMSTDRTLALSKIAHLGRDLGLPDDFRRSLVYEYPMYFRVLESQDPLDVEGPKLELVRWSPRLAVTEDAKKAQEQSTNGKDNAFYRSFSDCLTGLDFCGSFTRLALLCSQALYQCRRILTRVNALGLTKLYAPHHTKARNPSTVDRCSLRNAQFFLFKSFCRSL